MSSIACTVNPSIMDTEAWDAYLMPHAPAASALATSLPLAPACLQTGSNETKVEIIDCEDLQHLEEHVTDGAGSELSDDEGEEEAADSVVIRKGEGSSDPGAANIADLIDSEAAEDKTAKKLGGDPSDSDGAQDDAEEGAKLLTSGYKDDGFVVEDEKLLWDLPIKNQLNQYSTPQQKIAPARSSRGNKRRFARLLDSSDDEDAVGVTSRADDPCQDATGSVSAQGWCPDDGNPSAAGPRDSLSPLKRTPSSARSSSENKRRNARLPDSSEEEDAVDAATPITTKDDPACGTANVAQVAVTSVPRPSKEHDPCQDATGSVVTQSWGPDDEKKPAANPPGALAENDPELTPLHDKASFFTESSPDPMILRPIKPQARPTRRAMELKVQRDANPLSGQAGLPCHLNVRVSRLDLTGSLVCSCVRPPRVRSPTRLANSGFTESSCGQRLWILKVSRD